MLGRYEEGELEKKEIEYIALYDSFNRGYNSTLGGEGARKLLLNELDILEEFKNGTSINKIAENKHISAHSVAKVIKASNIDTNKNASYKKQIVMCDKLYNHILLFDSIMDAAKYFDMYDDRTRLRNFYNAVNKACETYGIAYKYRWQYMDALINNNMIFRTKIEKEAYINGANAYKMKGTQYFVVDDVLDNIITSEIYACKVCGNLITKRDNTGMCKSCSNVAAKGKAPKPSKMELIDLVNRGMRKCDIAEMYGRNSSTIATWFRNYGI